MIIATGISGFLSAANKEYDSLRLQADELYRAGKTDTAYWVYEGLTREGLEDALLFANMGNACMQQNKVAEAVSWYERSLHLHPENEMVVNNLKYALNKLELEYQDPDAIASLMRYPVFSIALWWIAAVLLGLFFFIKRSAIRMISAALSGLMIIAATFFTFNDKLTDDAEAIVLANTSVYSLPSELSDEVYEFSLGSKITICKQEKNWCQVQIRNGRKGWVRSAQVALVN